MAKKRAPQPKHLSSSQLQLLFKLLSQRTAPFREMAVSTTIQETLAKAKVPFFVDPAGNIVIGTRNQREYEALLRTKTREPLRIFMAHMDHPGFHGREWLADDLLEVRWLGGSPTRALKNAPLWVRDQEGNETEARLVRATIAPHGRGLASAVIRLKAPAHKTSLNLGAPERLFGAFRFPQPFRRQGKLIHTHAADDLVGAFSVVALAIAEARMLRSRNKPFLGLITRAEEVGFIGALAHLDLGWLKNATRPVLFVSLECSKAIPGAEIGKGPVVRLGDRFSVFDAPALHLFSKVAEEALPGRHQRKLMDGGTCEASTAITHGLAAVGASVPLGNYHNEEFFASKRGAKPSGGAAPEFVHLDDVAGLLTLCRALARTKTDWDQPWKEKREALTRTLESFRPLLQERLTP